MTEIKPQNYKELRPEEYFTEFHQRARDDRQGRLTYDLVRIVLTPPTVILYRSRAIGTENIPKKGPVLIAPNHFSQMDHFFCGIYMRRKLRFMGKSQMFGPPVLTSIYKRGGVFPVRRGHRDEEAFKTAYAILDHGHTLLVYAEGGRSRTRNLGEPRPGVGRIALESGVPVVPVAIHGSAGVRGWRKFRFPKVTIQFGEPLNFPVQADPSREQQLEAAGEIFDRVRIMYTALEERGRGSVIRSLRDQMPEQPTAGEASTGS